MKLSQHPGKGEEPELHWEQVTKESTLFTHRAKTPSNDSRLLEAPAKGILPIKVLTCMGWGVPRPYSTGKGGRRGERRITAQVPGSMFVLTGQRILPQPPTRGTGRPQPGKLLHLLRRNQRGLGGPHQPQVNGTNQNSTTKTLKM